MSSAILYLAIVAIWACVLIPRWLRRDPARGVPAPLIVAEPSPAAEDRVLEDADEAMAPMPAPARAAEPLSPEESRRRMLAARRRLQALAWMWERIESGLRQAFKQDAAVQQLLPRMAQDVEQGRIAASTATSNSVRYSSENGTRGS